MKKYILNTYDYKPTEGYKSVIEQNGYEYNESPSENRINKKDYRKYAFDDVHPLVMFNLNNIKVNVEDLSKGGEMKLTGNVTAETPITLSSESEELILSLNGKKIVAKTFTENDGAITEGNTDSYAFWVQKDGKLTIEGEGEVRAIDAKYSMAVWCQGGEVTIKGGTFYNGGDGCDLIYASNAGKVYIYGGEFHATKRSGEASGTKNEYSALNLKDNSNSEILVYGGKFYGFNPANNVSEGPNTNFVAEGYESIEIEPNVFEVREIQ